MRKLLAITALVGFAVLTVPGTAGAVCVTPSTVDGLAAAQVVFVGTVSSVENGDRTATLDVQWVWKGKGVLETVTVHGGSTDPTVVTAEDRQFQLGITYLVASSTAGQPYEADRCTVTRPWNGVGSVIPPNYQNAVGAEIGSSPDPIVIVETKPNILDNPLVPIGTGVLVVVGLFFAISRVFRGPEHVAKKDTKHRGQLGNRSRLPKLGRSSEGLSGGLRRSGVSQAKKLRGVRNSKRRRKSSKRSRAKAPKGGLRAGSRDVEPDADVDDPRVNA